MPDAPIDVVRQIYEKPARITDPDGSRLDLLNDAARAAVLEFFAPDVEMHEDPRFLEGGLHVGREALEIYFEQFTASFDEYVVDAPEYTAVDSDRVLAEFRLRMRGKESGATVEVRPGWIYTVRGEKVVRIEAYVERADARAAAGLSD